MTPSSNELKGKISLAMKVVLHVKPAIFPPDLPQISCRALNSAY